MRAAGWSSFCKRVCRGRIPAATAGRSSSRNWEILHQIDYGRHQIKGDVNEGGHFPVHPDTTGTLPSLPRIVTGFNHQV